MSSKLLKACICDRCGEEVFLNAPYSNLDILPRGWQKIRISYKCRINNLLVCPRCYAIYKNILATNEKRFVDTGFFKVESEVSE